MGKCIIVVSVSLFPIPGSLGVLYFDGIEVSKFFDLLKYTGKAVNKLDLKLVKNATYFII